MRILIVSATLLEAKQLIDFFKASKSDERSYTYRLEEAYFEILITGVGLTASTFHLTNKLCSESFDYVLNIGICGSFNDNYPIGKVVSVGSQAYGDLGVEDNISFIPFEKVKLPDSENVFNSFYFIKPENEFSPDAHLPSVKSITVNRVHGNEESISSAIKNFNPDIESMEGLAVFYVCMNYDIPFSEIRAVSNKVEKRDISKWNIPLALKNLTEEVVQICHSLAKG